MFLCGVFIDLHIAHINDLTLRLLALSKYTYILNAMCVYVYEIKHTHTHTHIYIYIYRERERDNYYICIYMSILNECLCKYVCMYVCMYVFWDIVCCLCILGIFNLLSYVQQLRPLNRRNIFYKFCRQENNSIKKGKENIFKKKKKKTKLTAQTELKAKDTE